MNWNDSVDPIFLPVRVSLVRHRCLISKAEARIRIALHFSSDSPTSILLSSPRWREFFVTIATRRLSTPVISKITEEIFGEDGERTKEKKRGNTARYCRQVLDLPCALQSPVIRPTTKLNSRSWREREGKNEHALSLLPTMDRWKNFENTFEGEEKPTSIFFLFSSNFPSRQRSLDKYPGKRRAGRVNEFGYWDKCDV